MVALSLPVRPPPLIPPLASLLPSPQTFMARNVLWVFFVEWIPAWSLYRGLYEMGAYAFQGVYTNQPGMQFSNLSDKGNGMLATWGIFLVEAVVFMVLG